MPIVNRQSSIVNRNRVLYFEPFSGISGDMMLGALLDLGIDLAVIERQLRLLPVEGYELSVSQCSRAGLRATKFNVDCHDFPQAKSHGREHHGHGHEHTGRSFRAIREMIQSSALSAWVKDKSIESFRRLAEAESKIHNRPLDEVHFHEIGAVDSIIDIVGSMVAVEQLLPLSFSSGAVNVGHGTVRCQHGLYPVPAPATQELLKGVPTYADELGGELTTPTGATLLVTLVTHFGPRPPMKIQQTGYGAGERDLAGSANVLRVTVGEEIALQSVSPEEEVTVIEATIDDMNPQIYGYFQDKALAEGALDVYLTPIQMKKNRPGVKLTVICARAELDSLTRLIFAETTTIGIRYTLAQRKTLQRQFAQVQTEYGAVTIKVSSLDGYRMNFVPEYEDCRRLAREKGVALKDVQAAAARAYLQSVSS